MLGSADSQCESDLRWAADGRKISVTRKDIANSPGVSKGTVSMALNGNEQVARKTRDAVLNKTSTGQDRDV